jgi:vacuolar-type H+-ATPase subunit I/STV1
MGIFFSKDSSKPTHTIIKGIELIKKCNCKERLDYLESYVELEKHNFSNTTLDCKDLNCNLRLSILENILLKRNCGNRLTILENSIHKKKM